MLGAALMFWVLAASQSSPQDTLASGSVVLHPGEPGDGLEPGATRDGEFIVVDHDRNFLSLYSDLHFLYTGRGYRDRPFRYRLFVPHTASPADRRPLLVWLHGKGESGDDNRSQLRLSLGA